MANNKKTVTGLTERNEIIIMYLAPVFGLIFALIKDNKTPKRMFFHYNQSATIFILLTICSMLLKISSMFFNVTSIIIYPLTLVIYGFGIFTIIKANNNEKYEIPVICDLSKMIFGKEE